MIIKQDCELSPAYGRDYQNAAEVKRAWEENKDFLGDYQLQFQLCNKQDFAKGVRAVLRYCKLRKVVVVTA